MIKVKAERSPSPPIISNLELAKDWNSEKNGNLKPEHVTTNSGKKVWWKCDNSNNSLRTVVITRMICCIDTHVLHVEYFNGLKELTLPPATTKNIDIVKQDIYKSFCGQNLSAICNPNDKVKIPYDNYDRKYIMKTDLILMLFDNSI